jgi:hypothetical protein
MVNLSAVQHVDFSSIIEAGIDGSQGSCAAPKPQSFNNLTQGAGRRTIEDSCDRA